MKRRCRTGLVLLCLVLAAPLGCSKKPRRAVDWEEGLTGGREVFRDDFERAELGADWTVEAPSWRIVDGWLHNGARPENAGAWLAQQLPERVRIEFKARSMLPAAGSFEGDLKCEVFCSAPHHKQGYILIFGGWTNTQNVIARLDEHGDDRLVSENRKVVAGQIYTWTIVRTDATLRWYIDGKPFLHYRDPEPLTGRYFGFNNWSAQVYFDEVRVWEL